MTTTSKDRCGSNITHTIKIDNSTEFKDMTITKHFTTKLEGEEPQDRETFFQLQLDQSGDEDILEIGQIKMSKREIDILREFLNQTRD